jgi:hypothetical protein
MAGEQGLGIEGPEHDQSKRSGDESEVVPGVVDDGVHPGSA